MSLNIWILFMFGFAIYLRSSAKLCERRYVNGKWISRGDCGHPGRILVMQKELQLKIKDEKKKCIASEEWTVFQRRINGDVDFYRGWDDYKKGFGDCDGNLWLGLEELHEKTKEGDMELEINMITKDGGIHLVAKYSNFSIGHGTDNFTLHISGFSGNTSVNGLSYHNNHQFTTKDADNDNYSSVNCATLYEGAWWYASCYESNLNGNFNKTDWKGVWWGAAPGGLVLRFVEMKFRARL